MAEPTVLGYIKEQPERLKYVFENKDVFVKPFVDVFTKNNIKKIILSNSTDVKEIMVDILLIFIIVINSDLHSMNNVCSAV